MHTRPVGTRAQRSTNPVTLCDGYGAVGTRIGQIQTAAETIRSARSEARTNDLDGEGRRMVSSGGGERDARGALPRRLHRARPVDLQITRSLTTQRRPGPETSVVRGTAYGNAAAQTGSMLQGVPQDPPEKKPGDGGLCGSRSSEVPTGSNCIGSSPIHRRHRRCRLPQRALAGLRVYPPSVRTPAGPPGQIILICITDAAGIESIRPAQNGGYSVLPAEASTPLRDRVADGCRHRTPTPPSAAARTCYRVRSSKLFPAT